MNHNRARDVREFDRQGTRRSGSCATRSNARSRGQGLARLRRHGLGRVSVSPVYVSSCSVPRTPQSGETPPSVRSRSTMLHSSTYPQRLRDTPGQERAPHSHESAPRDHDTRHPQHPLRRVQHERQTRHARHKSATRVHASAARSLYPTGCEARGRRVQARFRCVPQPRRFTSLRKGSPPA